MIYIQLPNEDFRRCSSCGEYGTKIGADVKEIYIGRSLNVTTSVALCRKCRAKLIDVISDSDNIKN